MQKLDNSVIGIEKYFKNRYLIAEYEGDDDDNLINIWDNVRQFASDMCMDLDDAYSYLWHYLHEGKRFYLIDLKHVEDDCFIDADIDTIRTMFPRP